LHLFFVGLVVIGEFGWANPFAAPEAPIGEQIALHDDEYCGLLASVELVTEETGRKNGC